MDDRRESAREGPGWTREARVDEAARREVLRRDGRRELGENLERAAKLIKASFELRDSFSATRR